ncbi:MAG TPA: nicotinamide riboside transporter PnuC [Edaphocola sp.]|nr:nicotinamide riboside transporter PnuC [Edaphocola sp.]
MNWDTIATYMQSEWQHATVLELVAVLFAVCEVLLAYRNKVWLYPAGIISTIIYIWIFVQPTVRLYADASLNLYYLAMSIYGWVVWTQRRQNNDTIPISKANRSERLTATGIFAAAFALMYIVLSRWTDSNTPMADAFVSSVAWAGMWLLARRKIENWIVLNISNAAAIPLLLYKHLLLTTLLTVFLFTVAVLGYYKWKKIMNAEPEARERTPKTKRLSEI